MLPVACIKLPSVFPSLVTLWSTCAACLCLALWILSHHRTTNSKRWHNFFHTPHRTTPTTAVCDRSIVSPRERIHNRGQRNSKHTNKIISSAAEQVQFALLCTAYLFRMQQYGMYTAYWQFSLNETFDAYLIRDCTLMSPFLYFGHFHSAPLIHNGSGKKGLGPRSHRWYV